MDAKRKIVEMLAAGKLSTAEASRLLNSLDEPIAKPAQKKLVIQSYADETEEPEFWIEIPLSFIKAGLMITPLRSFIRSKIGNTEFEFSALKWKDIVDLAIYVEPDEVISLKVKNSDDKSINLKIYIK